MAKSEIDIQVMSKLITTMTMSRCVHEVENNHEQIITLHLSLVLVANLWKTPSKIFTQL
jgi:hypothetical protein